MIELKSYFDFSFVSYTDRSITNRYRLANDVGFSLREGKPTRASAVAAPQFRVLAFDFSKGGRVGEQAIRSDSRKDEGGNRQLA